MSLQSFGFFGFLLVVAAVYLHLPRRWQSPFLLAASWVFYALAMPSMLPVTIAIAVFTWLCGRALTGAHKAAVLRVGVIGLLLILAFFKYNGAFAGLAGWQAIGCSDEEVARLCDIAMDGDRNIAAAYKLDFTLGDTIARGGKCCELFFRLPRE